jgi:hypothetical protein
MADAGDKKRRREIAPTVEDVLYRARFFINNDPFKQYAPVKKMLISELFLVVDH